MGDFVMCWSPETDVEYESFRLGTEFQVVNSLMAMVFFINDRHDTMKTIHKVHDIVQFF